MALAYAPSSHSIEAASAAPRLARAYLIVAPSGRTTLSDTGPSTRGLVRNDAGRWAITDAVPGQRVFRSGTGQISAY